MKKLLIIESVLFVLLFATSRINNSIPFVLNLIALIGFPIYKVFSGMKRDMDKFAPKEEPKQAEPTEEQPAYKTTYVFLRDTETIGNKFVRYFKEDLQENDEFYRSNKDLKEEYFNEKIFQYEPLEIPYKIEGDQVFSYMKNDEWQFVGRIRESQMFLVEKSIETKLFLMPNTYKRVGDGYLQKESGDAYFGLLVKVEQ